MGSGISRCKEMIRLSAEEYVHLNGLRGAQQQVSTRLFCSLDEHDGAHLALAQATAEQGSVETVWWLRWTGLSREVIVLDPCPVREHDGLFCDLPTAHSGRHTFEAEQEAETETRPALMWDRQIRLNINMRAQGSDAREAQKLLVKESGADFDAQTSRWYLRLSPGTMTAKRLNPLFEAARQYGTAVFIDQEHGPSDDEQKPTATESR